MALWAQLRAMDPSVISSPKGDFAKVPSSRLHTNLCGSGLEKSWVQHLESHTCVTAMWAQAV